MTEQQANKILEKLRKSVDCQDSDLQLVVTQCKTWFWGVVVFVILGLRFLSYDEKGVWALYVAGGSFLVAAIILRWYLRLRKLRAFLIGKHAPITAKTNEGCDPRANG
jgi:hypothetical protein